MEMNDILQSNNKTYSWEDINNMTNKIVEYVNKNNLQFEFVIGVPKGGLILGVMLSHRLNVPYMELSDFLNKPFSRMKILLVDEIVDRGNTMKRYLRYFDQLNTTIITLHYKSHSSIKPDYYVEEVPNDVWCVYPWESEAI